MSERTDISGISIGAIPWLLPLSRLTGPLFDKELRVSSRQRRFYALRFAYVALLAIVVSFLWLSVVRSSKTTSAVVWISRMPEAGKQIVMTVLWFQFIAGQLLAAVLLSGAIGGEIRQRSLDVLLTTPLSRFQIVVGKLLSKLLQLVLLLAISLPLLAIVRVFGGVPWDFVISGLCITLTAAVFVGSLSLFFSITNRQTHQVIMGVLGWCLILWVGLACVLAALVYANHITAAQSKVFSELISPPVVMMQQTRAMLAGQAGSSWRWHCLIMLAMAVVMVTLSIWRLRRARLDAIGASDHQSPQDRRRWPWRGTIRRVKGAPIVWKELRRPYLPRNRRQFWSLIFSGIAIGVIVTSLIVLVVAGYMPLAPAAGGAAYLLWLLFVISATSASAAAITREKEARTWPILLTTPLDNGEIVRGKAIGALRWNLPLLAPLPILGLVILLYAFNELSGAGEAIFFLVGWVFRVLGGLVFLIGMALYMGTRVKTTTVAVVTTFGIYLVSRMVLSIAAMTAVGVSGAPMVMMLIAGLFQGFVYVLVGLGALSAAIGRVRRDVFA